MRYAFLIWLFAFLALPAAAQYSYTPIQNETIWGENLSTIKKGATLEECQALCDKFDDKCGSFDYNPASGECAANMVTTKKRYETEGWTHYQRSGGSAPPVESTATSPDSEKAAEPEPVDPGSAQTIPPPEVMATDAEPAGQPADELDMNPLESDAPGVPQGAVKLVDIVGEVEIIPEGGDAIAPAEGGIFSLTDRVFTGPDAQVILEFPDGSRIVVRELTDVKLAAYDYGATTIKTRLWLQAGELDVDVRPRSSLNSDWRITTPTATCSIRGTVFGVKYSEADGTTVGVREGEVEVADNSGRVVFVKANEQVKVTEDGTGEITPLSEDAATSADSPESAAEPDEAGTQAGSNSSGIVVLVILAVVVIVIMIIRKRRQKSQTE